MATAQHYKLTGADLHEPKGIATADAGTVYVADGAESGTWQISTDSQEVSVFSYATKAALAEQTGSVGIIAILIARTIDSDGGGGIFRWDDSDLSSEVTADPQSGIYVAHTIDTTGATGAWVRLYEGPLHVKWYGAIGDGSTDDTTAIQATYDAVDLQNGGEVHFDVGTYMIAPPVDKSTFMWTTTSSQRDNYGCILVGSNTTTTGEGPASIIKLTNTLDSDGTPTDGRGDYATTHMFINKLAPDLPRTIVNDNIHFSYLKFDGNWINESGEGVSFSGVRNFSIKNCHFTKSFYEVTYLVFCRNGEFAENFVYLNGLQSGALQDGGGPLIDNCESVTVRDNHITDSGFYAILMVDAWNCKIINNYVTKRDYPLSAGFQAIRGDRNKQCLYADNYVSESGFAGLWDHRGHDNTIRNNTITFTGFDAAAGGQIHGIFVDGAVDDGSGRSKIIDNTCIGNKGAGIAMIQANAFGDISVYNAGTRISGNTCLYNGRDGITVYGDYHRITDNILEGNGISEPSGILGDGYSGLALNGSSYCTITNNTIQDITSATDINVNLDAQLAPTYNSYTPLTVTHTTRTQNYAIRELPAGVGELQVISMTEQGNTVTVTQTDHTKSIGDIIFVYGSTTSGYNGWFEVVSTPTADTYTYSSNTGDSPAEGSIFVSEDTLIAGTNVITNNNLMNNIANPGITPSSGGYNAFSNAVLTCGIDSILAHNIGQ